MRGEVMTREEAIEEINKVFEPAFANYIITALTEGVTASDKALEQEPCEDVVSLNGVIDTIEWYRTNPQHFTEDNLIEDIKGLPPVTPKQRTGHWVEIGDEPYDTWECDNCGFVIDGSGCVDPEEYRDIYKYCPNCGAKMEG
jgi:rubredoxin